MTHGRRGCELAPAHSPYLLPMLDAAEAKALHLPARVDLSILADAQHRIRVDRRHQYTVLQPGARLGPGRVWAKVPSVTQVLDILAKPALIGWAARIERQALLEAVIAKLQAGVYVYREDIPGLIAEVDAEVPPQHAQVKVRTGDQGTDIHDLIMRVCRGEDVRQHLHHPAVAVWWAWALDVGLVPIWAEGRVYNHSLRYAGTMDLLCLVRRRLTLLDWKTGGVYAPAHLQSVGYMAALMDMGVLKPHPDGVDGLIVRVPRDGGPVEEVPVLAPAHSLLPGFTGALMAHRGVRELEALERKRKRLATIEAMIEAEADPGVSLRPSTFATSHTAHAAYAAHTAFAKERRR